MSNTDPTSRSGYRFWLHHGFKSERDAGDAMADFISQLAIASFRLVQWCITIGAVQAFNKVAPSEWLLALQVFLWVVLTMYIVSNLSTVEIDLFRQVNTRLKWWINLIITLAMVGGLVYATYQATHSAVEAVTHASSVK